MRSRTVRILAVAAAIGAVAIAFGPWQRAIPDASADSLDRDGVKLVRVFEDIRLRSPVAAEQPPDDRKRWYVVEQRGRLITFVTARERNREVALDITGRVEFGGEQGLLGLAFHPQYGENGYIFVNYISTEGERHTRVSRFKRKGAGPTFDPRSEKVLLRVPQPYSNHNGGQVSFGPDGMLYIAMGDGGLAGDPQNHGQDTTTLLGAMLRIDVDGGDPYAIPPDNPFANGGGAAEIFAWGLRNPWRFSFDRQTQKLWAGDVGQNDWEEIDVIDRGKNYGWNIREGTRCYDPPAHLAVLGSGDCGSKAKLEPPVFEYSQAQGDRSVTGGFVYRGKRWPKIRGQYVYGDFVSGRIWAYDMRRGASRLLIDTGCLISSFVEGADGEIGVLDYGSGALYHLQVR